MVMRMVFENYGVEKYYDSLTESVTRTLGFIKYKDAQNITSACNALDRHTDKTFTTILHQNQVKGLEIKTKDGQWVGFDYSRLHLLYYWQLMHSRWLTTFTCQQQKIDLTKFIPTLFFFLKENTKVTTKSFTNWCEN